MDLGPPKNNMVMDSGPDMGEPSAICMGTEVADGITKVLWDPDEF